MNVNKKKFIELCGSMMPPRRNMEVFDGYEYECACGGTHLFGPSINVISEGFGGRFVFSCPRNQNSFALVKTDMKFGFIFKGLKFLAGYVEEGLSPEEI